MNNLDKLITLALEEDIGEGDITTDAIVDPKITASADIVAKQDIVVAGLEVAKKIFFKINPKTTWEQNYEDGDKCEEGDVIATVEGNAKDLLAAERTVLNFMQHLSGIATATSLFVETVAHTKVKILDTRKTTPGMRALEKQAVLLGDGQNHRMGLYDRYLIKNNHIEIAGSVTEAVGRVGKKRKAGVLLEVETRNLDEVREALLSGVDIIMLDNMSVVDIRKAVALVKKKAKLEVSGNITLENILHYAVTGVDFISVGAITHSAPAADIHLVLRT